MKCVAVIVILVCLLINADSLGLSNFQSTIVYVNESGNIKNSPACLISNSSDKPCRTLFYALKNTHNNTVIYILSDIVTLNKTVVQLYRKNVSIIGGQKTPTLIQCGWGFPNLFNSSSVGAGLSFIHASNFTLSNLIFHQCGSLQVNRRGYIYKRLYFRSAVFLDKSSNIFIYNISINNSNGAGLVMLNASGRVEVNDSSFFHNGALKIYQHFRDPGNHTHYICGGGGIHLSLLENITESVYIIKNCNFNGNFKYTLPSKVIPGMGNGGGLQLRFDYNTTNTTSHIINCTFYNNSAQWGGGAFVGILKSAKNNKVNISNSSFERNEAFSRGGGGLDLGLYEFDNASQPMNNTILLYNCSIVSNLAIYGGGNTVFSDQNPRHKSLYNDIIFERCTWKNNKANFSAAVDVSPNAFDNVAGGFSLVPQFIDCHFENNTIISRNDQFMKPQYSFDFSSGVFLATSINVNFLGNTQFINNTGTALHLTSTMARFWKNSTVLFSGNNGNKGGAVALVGMAYLQFENDSTFYFTNNYAQLVGGAIHFYSIDQHDYFSSRTCFLKPFETFKVNRKSVYFYFNGNRAKSGLGHDIFGSTLSQCNRSCLRHRKSNKSIDNLTACIANFTFEDSSFNITSIATLGHKPVKKNNVFKAIPGKPLHLKPEILDENGNNITSITVFRISVDESSGIETDEKFQYTTTGEIELSGIPGKKGKVILETNDIRRITTFYDITMEYCPPGYELSKTKKICMCAARKYQGIASCRDDLKQAYIISGHWIGYIKNVTATENTLLTSTCPYGFCNSTLQKTKYHLLPDEANWEKVDEYICEEGRTGILCGDCRDNYSVYYHSKVYKCGNNNNLCNFGPLLYVLTDFLPVTVIFLTVLFLDINFTSGAVNGFIFFAQVLDLMHVGMTELVPFNFNKYFLYIYEFFYGLFNLDLRGEKIEFCIWKGATTLDTLVLKYATIVYALVLVICLVLVMNYCSCSCLCRCIKRQSFSTSVIQGLSAFLVICYSQCTRVTFQLLRPGIVHQKNLDHNDTVVYYNGNVKFFSNEHLKYAIPALFFFVTLVAIPPIILLFNSITAQVIRFISKRSYHIPRWLANKLLMTRMKPFLDAFQGCFRDEWRCFAGIYFCYRVLILAVHVFATTITLFYISVEILLIIMIGTHAIIQPYQKKWHNILDTLIFANLAIINGISAYIYINYSQLDEGESFPAAPFQCIQLVLIYLPMVYIVSYGLLYLLKRLRNTRKMSEIFLFFKKRYAYLDTIEYYSDDEIPARLLSGEFENYHSFNESYD